jgi:hypothetical protein
MRKIVWPKKSKFAFTIVDDTDKTTLKNGPIIYNFLNTIGIKSTKTVWVYDGQAREDNYGIVGETCENKEYLNWVQSLKREGFEIALHNMSWSNSRRDRIIVGIELFKKHFGDYPKLLAQHNDTVENESIYWGRKRLSFPTNLLFDALSIMNPRRKNSKIYSGDNEASPFFWGDICKEKIKYVRNFIFSDINTLKACPQMPYHDTSKPYVNKWFASTEAPDVCAFNKLLSKNNIDRLEREGGCCIVYTHFGSGFVENGAIHQTFSNNMKELVRRPGWFATASEILDHLEAFDKTNKISKASRMLLEINWLIHKIKVGGTS